MACLMPSVLLHVTVVGCGLYKVCHGVWQMPSVLLHVTVVGCGLYKVCHGVSDALSGLQHAALCCGLVLAQ